MKRHLLTAPLVAAFILAGSQTQALSCMRPDVARSFELASSAAESYVILRGTFDFDALPSRDTGNINAPKEIETQATFSGMFLGGNGFEAAPDLDVTVHFSCAGPWCGNLTSQGQEVLAFVQQSQAGLTLEVAPCGTWTFENPTRAQINQVLSCMNGSDCTPQLR